jgi:hypothetical protein
MLETRRTTRYFADYPPDNHKATTSSDSASSSLRLKPTGNPHDEQYDLSFSESGDNYAYRGTRSSGDGQYVLIFDPARKAFVIHQVDSAFDMNLTSTPWEQDPAVLQKDYEQLMTSPKRQQSNSDDEQEMDTFAKAQTVETKRRKTEKVAKPKKVREPTPESEEESDDGLTIEYPDGEPAQRYHSQSTPIFRRAQSEESDKFEDIMQEEELNQDVEALALPSPVHGDTAELDAEEELDELDLEAELEQALQTETQAEEAHAADESSESEEE